MVHDPAAGMAALQRFLRAAIRRLVEIHAELHNPAHVVRPFMDEHVHTRRRVFMAACNHCILIVQVKAVVLKIEHSRYAPLGEGTV